MTSILNYEKEIMESFKRHLSIPSNPFTIIPVFMDGLEKNIDLMDLLMEDGIIEKSDDAIKAIDKVKLVLEQYRKSPSDFVRAENLGVLIACLQFNAELVEQLVSFLAYAKSHGHKKAANH